MPVPLDEIERITPSDLSLVSKPRYQVRPNPSQQGYLTPRTGDRGVLDKTWAVGKMERYKIDGDVYSKFVKTEDLAQADYGFKFHYNPSSFSQSSPTGFDYYPSELDPGLPLMAAPSTLSFQVMLNRSEDVLESTPFNKKDGPVLGCTNFSQLGTMYDVEWFFRTVNGIRTNGGADAMYESADIGLLLPSPVLITFSKALRYAGYISNLQIDHLKFTPSMIPTISLMNISVARFSTASFVANAAPEGSQ